MNLKTTADVLSAVLVESKKIASRVADKDTSVHSAGIVSNTKRRRNEKVKESNKR
jgi:hypothetical protein